MYGKLENVFPKLFVQKVTKITIPPSRLLEGHETVREDIVCCFGKCMKIEALARATQSHGLGSIHMRTYLPRKQGDVLLKTQAIRIHIVVK